MIGGCAHHKAAQVDPHVIAPTYPDAHGAGLSSAAVLYGWKDVFRDARLQRLVEVALQNNRDLRVAVLNVEAARLQYRVQKAAFLPQLNATGSYATQKTPTSVASATVGGGFDTGGQQSFQFSQYNAGISLTSFEIDLFGRLRSQSRAAQQRYLATEEGRKAAHVTLVGAVIEAYFNERLAVEQVTLTESTLDAWRKSLALNVRLHDAGQVGQLEVEEATGPVKQAEADLEARRRAGEQARNALVLLLGQPMPEDLPKGTTLAGQGLDGNLPSGLPSDLLLNRPDIRQAEHTLLAANADVAAARAAYFPRISLTGALGLMSLDFGGLFNSKNNNWSFTPQISQPIFQGGQIRNAHKLAKVQRDVVLAQYEKAIQTAFKEVADGLAGQATYRSQIEAQVSVVEHAKSRLALSERRFQAGMNTRLDVLDAQRTLYTAEQSLLVSESDQCTNKASLYRALGGGAI
jgi:NodT family efflux transporter outer membrane factor (OMF) lipoprotein